MIVADYVIKRLGEYNVKHVFLIVGGTAMYLNDSVFKQSKIKYICNHHEQASTMAAECYARITGGLGVVIVTSAAAMTNTITGLLGAWWDSIPVLIISGNARSTLLTYKRPNLRQLGVQDTRIVDIVKPITKYAVCVDDAKYIGYHLDKAAYLAFHGRQGPVWLDIPLDVESTEINETKLVKFKPPKEKKADLSKEVARTLEKLKVSKQPVIIVGSGVRASGSYDLFHKVLKKLKVPVLTTLTAQDIMWETHPYYGGRFGPYGTKKGNDLVKQTDCMLILGSRLYLWQIGYNHQDFGKNAYKIMVDIDKEELYKPTMNIQLPIHADAKAFLTQMDKQL